MRIPLIVLWCTTAMAADNVLFYDAAKSPPQVCVIPKASWSSSNPPQCITVPAARRHFESGRDAVEFMVWNRRLLSRYTLSIDKEVALGGLDSQLRGIQDAPLLSLAAPSLIPPPTKGGKPASAIKVEPLAMDGVLAQFLDEKLLYQPRITLVQQFSELDYGYESLKIDLEDLKIKIEDLKGAGGSCPGVIAPGSPVLVVLKCVSDLRDAVRKEHPPGRTYNNDDERTFQKTLDQVDLRLGDVRSLKERLAVQGFPAAIAQLEGSAEVFASKVSQFERNLETVRAAIDAFRVLRGSGADYLRGLKAGELKAQLKTKLKAGDAVVLNEAEINALIEKYHAYSEAALVRATKETAELEVETQKWAVTVAGRRTQAQTEVGNRRAEYRGIELEVQQVNRAVSDLFGSVNEAYERARIAQEMPTAGPVAITQTGNLIVYYTIKEEERFRPYRFESAAVAAGGVPGAVALPAAVQGIVSSAETPANAAPPPRPVYSGSFEVHQYSQATVVTGFVFSSLARKSWAVRTKPKADNATELESYVASSDDQVPQLHYLFGIDYYIQRKDTFPGAIKGGRRWIPGVYGGISLNEVNHYFFGAAFEPILGINFGVGLHYGRQTELQEGIREGMTITEMEAPTRNRMKPGVFGMIGLDLHLFSRIFGKVTGVGRAQ